MRIRQGLWSRSGASMVEVLVAFVVLILIMGIFSQAMGLAGRMLGRSGQMLENYRELAGGYYLDKGDIVNMGTPQEKTMTLTRIPGGDESFSIQVKLKTYTKKDGSGKLVEIMKETQAETGE